MSGHTILVIWVMKIFFVQFFCLFLRPLLNIFCFYSVHTISVLYCVYLCMKFSLGTLIFLKRSIVFPFYYFPVFLCIDYWGRFSYFSLIFFGTLHSLFSFAFCFSSFLSYLSGLLRHFAFFHFFFLGIVLITASFTMSQTSIHSFSGTLSFRSNPLNLFHFHSIIIRDLIYDIPEWSSGFP